MCIPEPMAQRIRSLAGLIIAIGALLGSDMAASGQRNAVKWVNINDLWNQSRVPLAASCAMAAVPARPIISTAAAACCKMDRGMLPSPVLAPFGAASKRPLPPAP